MSSLRYSFPRLFFCASFLLLLNTWIASAHAQPPNQQQNPFASPRAKVQIAPVSDYDLQNVKVVLAVDYPNRTFQGTATSTFLPKFEGITKIRLNCGKELKITSVTINNQPATFTREDNFLVLMSAVGLAKGKVATASVSYEGGAKQGGGFGSEGGFHWLNPSEERPDRIGFWTQGETGYNSEWAPMWDYPNDFATSETITTVPEDWTVMGNGVLISEKEDKNAHTKTFDWKMSQPHATYLLSLVAGPFAVKKSQWEDIPLWYVVPKSKADLIDASFGDTPDMLRFYSQVTGVKYPWPKYAQNAMYDFGGGMENVSNTILGENSLTDGRSGFRTMSDLNAHELGHQWFGDLVTCATWGDTWLNESFATFMELMYLESSQGKSAYERQIENNMQEYFQEARRYTRPISTNFYPNNDAMFDSHAYPKGGVVLHGLRQYMGDTAFYAGIKNYLTKNRNKPVSTQDFTSAMSEVGVAPEKVAKYIDQWVLKPGHPVLGYSTRYDEATSEVVLSVEQKQDTTNGGILYEIPTQVWVRIAGKDQIFPITLQGLEQEIRLKVSQKPEAVLLDPYHGFLREMKRVGGEEEDLAITLYAPNAVDRTKAMTRVMEAKPSASVVEQIVEAVRLDTGQFPIYGTIRPLTKQPDSSLRPFFLSLLHHKSDIRRAEAIEALGKLSPPSPQERVEEEKQLQGIIQSKTSMYREVTVALDVLLQRDPVANFPTLLAMSQKDTPSALRLIALRRLRTVVGESEKINPLLLSALKEENFTVVMTATQALRDRKDVSVLPALRQFQAERQKEQEAKDKEAKEAQKDKEANNKSNTPRSSARFLLPMLNRLISDLEKG